MPAEPTELSRKELRKLSKREAVAYSREMTKVHRAQERRRRIRNRVLLVAGLTVAIAVVSAAVAFGVYRQQLDAQRGPANMLSDGIVLTGDGSAVTAAATEPLQPGEDPVATTPTDDTPYLVAYVDYADPESATFAATNGEQLTQWLTAGYITVELHPLALSDESGDDYSTRAANAMACVAEYVPDSYLTVSDALLTAAAEEDFFPPEDDELLLMLHEAGVTDTDVDACVTEGRFRPWVEAASARATEWAIPNADVETVTETPLVLVDGTSYTGALEDPEALMTFISELYADESTG